MTIVTQWFNCKDQPPHYTGWYDFQWGNEPIRRTHYQNISDTWCFMETHPRVISSPSKVLSHCRWRGAFSSPGEGFECEDQDAP